MGEASEAVEDGVGGASALQGARAPRWRESLLAGALLVGATLALYAPALRLGWFAVDDGMYVVENPYLARLDAASLRALALEPYAMNWSPAHVLSYALDRALGGLRPASFHLSSVLWAAAGAWALWLLARRLLATRWAAWCAALLFLAHPAHVEAVAWISSRKDLVAAAFALAATCVWVRHAERPRMTSWLAASALFALAVLGKLSVAVLPAVLLLYDLLVVRRRGLAPWLDKLPWLALAAAVALRVAGVQPPTNVARSLVEEARVLCAFVGLASGFDELALFRPQPGASLAPGVALALAAVLLVAPAALLARARSRAGRLALVAWLWFVLALLPSQVLPFVHPVSDRYLYYPSAALALLGGLALEAFALRRTLAAPRARLACVAGLALVGLWSARTRVYLAEWGDPRSLWWHQARETPSVEAHRYLAQHELAAADRLAAALRGAIVPREELVALVAARDGPERAERVRRELAGPVAARAECAALERELVRSAGAELEAALALAGERALPEVWHSLGVVRLRLGDARGAYEAFERTRVEAARHPFDFVREPYLVLGAQGAGLAAEQLHDYPLATRLLRKALADQQRFGGAWAAGLAEQLARVEAQAGAR